MTIENTLERIAVALEALAAAKLPVPSDPIPLSNAPPEVQQAVAAAMPAEAPKRRGRPPKTQEAPVLVGEEGPPPPPGSPVEQEITLDMLRAELVRYANLPGVGSDTARKLMHVHSGAETLKTVPKDRIAVVYRAVQDAIAKEA